MPGKAPSEYVQYESKLHVHGNTITISAANTWYYSDPLSCYGIDRIPLGIQVSRSSGTNGSEFNFRIAFHQDKSVAGASYFQPHEYDESYGPIPFAIASGTDDYFWALYFPTMPGFTNCRFAGTTDSTDTWDLDFRLPGGGGDFREPVSVGDPDDWGLEDIDPDP